MLRHVRGFGSWRGNGSALAVFASGRRGQRQACLLNSLNDIGVERNSAGAACGIIDDNRAHARKVRMVPKQRRAEFSNSGCAESRVVCSFQERHLIERVASEIFVDLAQGRIVFQKWRDASGCAEDRKSNIDGIAENARVSKVMAGRHSGSIRHRKSGKQ